MFTVETHYFENTTEGSKFYRMVVVKNDRLGRSILIREWGKIGGSGQKKVSRGTVSQVEYERSKEERKRNGRSYVKKLSDVETYETPDKVFKEFPIARSATALDLAWISLNGDAVEVAVEEEVPKIKEPIKPLVRPEEWGTW